MVYLYSFLEIVYVIVAAPLIAGIQLSLEERIESKQGPSIFQPYYDLIKLFRKESLVPQISSPVFRLGPYVIVMFYAFLAMILPIITAFPLPFAPSADFIGGGLFFGAAAAIKKFSAIDSRSNYAHLGTSRSASLAVFTEPIMVLIFIMLGVISNTNNPFVINHVLRTSPQWYYSLVHGFVLAAFFMILIIETGQLPVESHTNGELGMIDQAMPFEYTGMDLAMYKLGSYMKTFILLSVFLNVYFIPFGVPTAHSGFLAIVVYMGIHLLKLLGMIVVFALLNTTVSKFRLYKNFDFLAVAFALAFLASLAYYIIK
ncbi:NADH-quinone oxidoreductase subunit H [Candidatus Sulfidibacterium hydrothermale]|uniref:respiratory chain complex I subunit 1 family protein n=1 Tax=Candidatus Sulfidibacterium hydrothermale TaxID=2875962 RepID=UPI001F0A15BF|nr:NADH-quinone oxidoreductase subunit H [Candidatus Sulfidibacterium hydrothermale]UBM63133.1 NADH-quinone oxidoreductase subunit H [Candidatus Sulfidibacterium hydrothermale]